MIPKPRARNPAIPGTTKDRTGAAGILRRAYADINRRFAGLLRDVLEVFDRIRTIETNDAAMAPRPVLYALTPEELAATSRTLQEALDRWIAAGRDPSNAFWWDAYDAEATQLGTAQTASNLGNLSPVYAAQRSLASIVYSDAYRNRVAFAQAKSYEHWTGLGAELRAELAQIIGRAVVDGKNPRAVRTEIADRLEVSRGRALGYAQTDITDTLRQARMAEADHAREEFGLGIGLLWTSALLPTTRPTHAARHRKVYTSAQVKAFYAVNGNRYRCHCSITECLLDEEGAPILTDALKRSMAKELAVWERSPKAKR